MSSELSREVTTEDVEEKSVSKSIARQETPFGELKYDIEN
jgi:hypothetical protein